MSKVGPQALSSAGEKRKRNDDIEDEPKAQSSGGSRSSSRSQTPDSSTKRLRTIGPTLPPADLNERPSTGINSDESGSSDSDDFGPSLPGATSTRPQASSSAPSSNPSAASNLDSTPQTRRDEWMLVPPSSGDWTAKVDPTKLKSRKFNTGKSARGSSAQSHGGGVDNSIWHETPTEKQERLRREMLGIKDPGTSKTAGRGSEAAAAEDPKMAESRRRLKEHNEKTRGATLYQSHQATNPREKEDDPSARAFDREKDIAGGMKINTSQRREMMNKAAGFGDRFASARYL